VGPSSFQKLDISLVFVSVSRPVILDQQVSANDKYSGSAIYPSFRLAHASSNKTPVIPVRISMRLGSRAKLNDVIDLREIFAPDAGMPKSEGFDDRHQFVGVSDNKDIEIAGIKWTPMEGERPAGQSTT
jgi:hypothetical protein